MGLQFNTTKAQSVLASRTDEAEAMKKAARVAVQAEHKLELETALAHQRSQHEAATTAASTPADAVEIAGTPWAILND